jgi:hypothetical protein
MGAGIRLDPILVLKDLGVVLIGLCEHLGILDGLVEGKYHFQPISTRRGKQREHTGILLEQFPQFFKSLENMINIEDHVASRLKVQLIALIVGEAGECEIWKELLQTCSICLIGGVADSGNLGL